MPGQSTLTLKPDTSKIGLATPQRSRATSICWMPTMFVGTVLPFTNAFSLKEEEPKNSICAY